jgi:hypothetical protein
VINTPIPVTIAYTIEMGSAVRFTALFYPVLNSINPQSIRASGDIASLFEFLEANLRDGHRPLQSVVEALVRQGQAEYKSPTTKPVVASAGDDGEPE